MTRFARGGTANRKKANEASSWAEMKADLRQASRVQRPGGAHKKPFDESKVITRLKNGHFLVRIGSYEKVFKTEAELKRWKHNRSDKRRQQRKQQREQLRVCFHCRQPGHMVSECPEVAAESKAGDVGAICFRCGAVDHSLSACPRMPKKNQQEPIELPFAKCFVCQKSGHLSRSCPENPRGLYPNGGSCLLCSSVEHLKRDCPLMQKQKAEAPVMTLLTQSAGQSLAADDEVPIIEEAPQSADADAASAAVKKRRKKVKVVTI